MLEVIFFFLPFHYPSLLLIPLSNPVEAGALLRCANKERSDNFLLFPCDSLADS